VLVHLEIHWRSTFVLSSSSVGRLVGVEEIALLDPSVEEEEEMYLRWTTTDNCSFFATLSRGSSSRAHLVAEFLLWFLLDCGPLTYRLSISLSQLRFISLDNLSLSSWC